MKIQIDEKSFEGRGVLGEIEFELEKGSPSVICGPSGCGKSTLLRLIAGLDEDFKGEISPRAGKVGFVFQEPQLLPWRSVRANIELVCNVDEACLIDGLLVEVGLEGQGDVMASKLSLGMARRVALARALVIKPEILILDEPFVSLDPKRAESLRKLTYNLISKHQLKALFVTHISQEAIQMGHQIHILGGQPSRIDKTIEVPMSADQRFNSTFVQTYLAENEALFAFS
ncbi:Aliphatic sulfonates import ATP-binding protein SsuB 1 [Candidatus Terasakiella magnetica]|uniref:Aliphatic sulfonates import ATP-binding protein SsuB 1 n=1 Tax=Candidatus Terasakiella magnetica TaxID=1867952 RepID=A0A1C3RL38_9PROT|nr:ATP-binding cassette domain-containing protein [Candidatus Terasakiella magnetica]SCA57975.1 Aliphatic sulfonates import ATP-binding protein SsuB 1 [Candidatus Terasakiella magnetica]